MTKPAWKIKAITIFIASSELVFKNVDKLKGMFMDFRVLSKTKRLDCRVGQSNSIRGRSQIRSETCGAHKGESLSPSTKY